MKCIRTVKNRGQFRSEAATVRSVTERPLSREYLEDLRLFAVSYSPIFRVGMCVRCRFPGSDLWERGGTSKTLFSLK